MQKTKFWYKMYINLRRHLSNICFHNCTSLTTVCFFEWLLPLFIIINNDNCLAISTLYAQIVLVFKGVSHFLRASAIAGKFLRLSGLDMHKRVSEK